MPLRVALLTPGPAVPGWLGEALAEAERRGEVVVAATIDAGPTPWGASRLLVEETSYRLQALLEGRAAASEARQLFPAAASARVTTPPRPDVDLLLDCSGAAAAPPIGRLGTLRCVFCGEQGELGLYRAMVGGFQGFEVVFCLYPPAGGRVEVARATLAPPDRARLRETRQAAYGPAGMLLRKALQRIAAGAPAPAEPGTPARAAAPVDAAALGRYALSRALRSIDGRWRSAQPARFWLEEMQNWFLAYRTDRSRFVRNTARACMDGFELLLPPPDSYYADPCVITVGGADHVFFEDWRGDRGKGAIAWMCLDGSGRLSAPEIVLCEAHHLSYPFVFQGEDGIFMVPESGAAGAVRLYRALDFPRRWRHEATLLEGEPAVDATLARHGGKWWVFVALGHHSHNEALHLFWAERLRGPWRPHEANPVKIDATSARPAGALFQRRGRLIRPAQDCSRTYGGAITLNEVLELTPERFHERAVEKLRPDWLPGNRGLHTLAQGERLEMIDGRMRARGAERFPLPVTAAARPPRRRIAAAALRLRSRAAR